MDEKVFRNSICLAVVPCSNSHKYTHIAKFFINVIDIYYRMVIIENEIAFTENHKRTLMHFGL